MGGRTWDWEARQPGRGVFFFRPCDQRYETLMTGRPRFKTTIFSGKGRALVIWSKLTAGGGDGKACPKRVALYEGSGIGDSEDKLLSFCFSSQFPFVVSFVYF